MYSLHRAYPDKRIPYRKISGTPIQTILSWSYSISMHNAPLPDSVNRTNETEAGPALSAVVAYDDVGAGQRAIRTLTDRVCKSDSLDSVIESIHHRAETVTSTLNGILHARAVLPRWRENP